MCPNCQKFRYHHGVFGSYGPESGLCSIKVVKCCIFIKTDPAGNIKPDKEKSTEKIDGVVATIMALDRAIRCGLDNGESVYDERGILLI